ncbi:hypothetical protein [Chitinibacter tainanensis]|uniref:hypothetical protein n=1 Tax=Chitinibacter tainanensis TaxID=230667 RepID=UPI0023546B87|nr:hypothetical protein [Chitinibacter tainanensis]
MATPTLDAVAAGTDNGCAGFNSLAEIGVSIVMADKPLHSGFFTSVHTTGASISMAGRGGGSFGCVGFHNADTPTLSRTCHPQLALSGRSLKPVMEAFAMPSHVRSLFQYSTLAIAVIALERNTPLIVVALAIAVFLLSHVIGGRNHA